MKAKRQLTGISVGNSAPVRLVGVINVSPESFYKGSIRTSDRSLAKLAASMTEEGADVIDIGAMSTAPYLTTQISEDEEIKRISKAISIVRRTTTVPLSVDTTRHRVAQAALDVGATLVNDVSGLKADPLMGTIAKKAEAVILMAHPMRLKHPTKDPISATDAIFKQILETAKDAGIPRSKIVLDPGIGFFRQTKIPWWIWDLTIIKHLTHLKRWGCPLLVGVSRKSFIGQLLDEKHPEHRLAGSLAATAASVLNGASLVRTHDIRETKQALLVTQALRDLKTA